MNPQKEKWCYTGRHLALRDSFVTVPGSKPKRSICGVCWEKRVTAESLIKQRKPI